MESEIREILGRFPVLAEGDRWRYRMGPHLDQVAPLLLQICTLATQDVSMEGGRDDEHEVPLAHATDAQRRTPSKGLFQDFSMIFR